MIDEEYINSKKYIRDKLFWMDRIKTLNEPVYIADKISSSSLSKRISFRLEPDLVDSINKFCKREDITQFRFFLSILAILIYKNKGKDKFGIGTTMINRRNEKELNTMGIFVNTVPIFVNISKEDSIVKILKKIGTELIGVMKHQKYQYSRILEDIRDENSEQERLFDITFNYQNAKVITDQRVEIEWINCGSQGNSLGIHVKDRENSGCLLFDYDYNVELFKGWEIELLHERYIDLLKEIISGEINKIENILIIKNEEKNLILEKFNDIKAEYPKDKTVVELFEEQVNRTPDNIAVVYENEKIIYRELNEKANQVALRLRELGVQPNDMVAIITERSLEMMVGIYGIIKSGAAYVSIDPEYLEERVRYILEDCQPKAVILWNAKLPVESEIPIIDLADREIYILPSENLGMVNTPNDLIYVIYTSGTTGNPKGVMVEHRGISNLCTTLYKEVFANYKTRINVDLLSSYVFDASIKNIFTPILSGHAVRIISDLVKMSGKELVRYYIENNIIVSDGTPIHLKLLIDNYGARIDLEKLLIGGEELTSDLFKDLLKLRDTIAIINVYGPTEATVDSTIYSC